MRFREPSVSQDMPHLEEFSISVLFVCGGRTFGILRYNASSYRIVSGNSRMRHLVTRENVRNSHKSVRNSGMVFERKSSTLVSGQDATRGPTGFIYFWSIK